jgi:hypothetical protein
MFSLDNAKVSFTNNRGRIIWIGSHNYTFGEASSIIERQYREQVGSILERKHKYDSDNKSSYRRPRRLFEAAMMTPFYVVESATKWMTTTYPDANAEELQICRLAMELRFKEHTKLSLLYSDSDLIVAKSPLCTRMREWFRCHESWKVNVVEMNREDVASINWMYNMHLEKNDVHKSIIPLPVTRRATEAAVRTITGLGFAALGASILVKKYGSTREDDDSKRYTRTNATPTTTTSPLSPSNNRFHLK